MTCIEFNDGIIWTCQEDLPANMSESYVRNVIREIIAAQHRTAPEGWRIPMGHVIMVRVPMDYNRTRALSIDDPSATSRAMAFQWTHIRVTDPIAEMSA